MNACALILLVTDKCSLSPNKKNYLHNKVIFYHYNCI